MLIGAGLFLVLFLSSCGSMASRSTLIGPRKGVDPMAAAEAYLRQYQPGPLPRLFQTTRIYDRHGVLLAETFGEGRRIWVPLDQISPHLIEATIATEDATFYTNRGVDPARIAGAAIKNLQEGEIVSGASTITMQLARNLFLGPDQRYDQSVDRKVLEAGLAQELTDLYSKDELLEMYVNLLNYGQLAYGPEAAAQVYFGKSAADLTLAEASLLAGLPQQPAHLNPYDDFEAARRRQRVVLDLMVRHEYLDASAADDVFSESVQLAGDRGLAPNRAPHFVQYLVEKLDAEWGPGFIARSGYQIYTTLDLRMQDKAQAVVQEKVAQFRPVYDMSNAALVAVKPGTAEIMAMVGSADFDDAAIAGQVNVALSPRQPGSAIKPILYAAAIEDQLVSPASILWDVPVTYTVGVPTALAGGNFDATDLIYQPRNYDSVFHGPVTVRTALANSYNIPTVKLLAALGVPRMLSLAHAMGVTSLNEDSSWYGLSLTLGGGEVTLLDLTSAYHTLANAGKYVPPRSVLDIRDSQGRPVEGAIEQFSVEPIQVLSEQTAFLVTDILSDDEARLPAFGAGNPLEISRPAAAKTGTTTDWRDNWTIGYTRSIVAGVWAGNSDGHPMQHASGVTGAAPIWHAFMEQVLADPSLIQELGAPDNTSGWSFVPPEGVVQLADCPPRAVCRTGGEYFGRAWLSAAGSAGPLADSIHRTPAAPVYVQAGDTARLAGFCSVADGPDRELLALPDGYGLTEIDAFLTGGSNNAEYQNINVSVDDAAREDRPRRTLDELHAIAWSIRNGGWADLGPCEYLQDGALTALALKQPGPEEGVRILVDMVAAQEGSSGGWTDGGVVEAAALARAVEAGVFGDANRVTGGLYALAEPIVNDWACPGQYVMGSVVNPSGAPVAGVRVRLRDPWGNEAFAVTKNGPTDYGMFDFPIYTDGPHDLSLTIVDDNGNELGPTVPIPHKQDATSDTPCHHVVLQGN